MKKIVTLSLILCAHSYPIIYSAADPITPIESKETKAEHACVDQIISKLIVDPRLDSDFFKAKDASYPFYIVEHENGHLENTFGEKITKEDATKIEHTAKCISSHQGEHLMSFCEAQLSDGGISLHVWGGLPAYFSSLTLRTDKDKNITCGFTVNYPTQLPSEKLSWTITKKTFKTTNENFKSGERLYGWLSVEFEEKSVIDGKTTTKPHKIEGFIKPIIDNPIPIQK
jgi:hypothetical protein